MKLLIPVDGSDYTRRALEWLAHHQWLDGAHAVTVVHVVPALPHSAAAFATPEMVHACYDDDARLVLAPVRDFFGAHPACPASIVHRVGHAAEWIARLATEGGHDLVVMGSHGRGAMLNLVMGSVATKVLASCTTPVLLVR